MTRSAPPPNRRTLPRWLPWLVLLAIVAAAVLFVATRSDSPTLEPVPEITLGAADPDVVRIYERARQLVQDDPRSATAWGDLGGVLRAHEFGPEAEACFRNAQQLDPSDYRWPYLLAVSLAATDEPQALACLKRAAKLAADKPHVQLRLAEALLNRNALDEAAVVIEQALQLAPDDPRTQLAKAQLLFARGQHQESRQWCERAIAGAGDKRAPRLLLAQLCRRLGDAEGAAREMAALAKLTDEQTAWDDPDVAVLLELRRDPHWRIAAADQLAADGRAPEAAELLHDLASGGDPSGDATDKLARELLRLGRAGDAESLLRGKLNANPDSERLHFQLGIALFARQQYAAAAGEFRRACELKPDSVDAHYNLGHALRKADQNDQAQEAFTSAIRLSPGHAFARANLAELLLEAGQPDKAREHLRVAARLAPLDPKVRELLARLPAESP